MSIDTGAQVAIILLAYGPCVVVVNLLGQVCTLGRDPRTKETLPDFCECRVGYPTSTSIPRVDELSMGPPIMGRHSRTLDFKWNIILNCLWSFIIGGAIVN